MTMILRLVLAVLVIFACFRWPAHLDERFIRRNLPEPDSESRDALLSSLNSAIQLETESASLKDFLQIKFGVLSQFIGHLSITELESVADLIQRAEEEKLLDDGIETINVFDVANRALHRLKSSNDLDEIDVLCRILTHLMAILHARPDFQLLMTRAFFRKFGQDVFALAHRTLFAFRHHRLAYCILDVLLYLWEGDSCQPQSLNSLYESLRLNPDRWREILKDGMTSLLHAYVWNFKSESDSLKSRYESLQVDHELLVAVLKDIRISPEVDYVVLPDYCRMMPPRELKAALHHQRFTGNRLHRSEFLAVEGLWLSWVSFIDQCTERLDKPGFRYPKKATVFKTKPWAQELRRKTMSLLPAARSEAIPIDEDILLINNNKVRQSLLDRLEAFTAPTPETIASVSDHLKTVKGDDLVVLLQILEVLLYRCANSDHALTVFGLIGDIVLPRADEVVLNRDDQDVFCTFLLDAVKRDAKMASRVRLSWLPPLAKILQNPNVIMAIIDSAQGVDRDARRCTLMRVIAELMVDQPAASIATEFNDFSLRQLHASTKTAGLLDRFQSASYSPAHGNQWFRHQLVLFRTWFAISQLLFGKDSASFAEPQGWHATLMRRICAAIRIDQDVALINDIKLRQSLLTQLDEFSNPTAETIITVSDHLKTVGNGDLVALLDILEVLLYRFANTGPIFALIGDIVLPRADAVALDAHGQDALSRFLLDVFMRDQNLADGVRQSWLPLLLNMCQDPFAIVAMSDYPRSAGKLTLKDVITKLMADQPQGSKQAASELNYFVLRHLHAQTQHDLTARLLDRFHVTANQVTSPNSIMVTSVRRFLNSFRDLYANWFAIVKLLGGDDLPTNLEKILIRLKDDLAILSEPQEASVSPSIRRVQFDDARINEREFNKYAPAA